MTHREVFPSADFLRVDIFVSFLEYNIRVEGGSVSAARLAVTASCRWNVKNSFGYILNLRADSALHGAPGEDP